MHHSLDKGIQIMLSNTTRKAAMPLLLNAAKMETFLFKTKLKHHIIIDL